MFSFRSPFWALALLHWLNTCVAFLLYVWSSCEFSNLLLRNRSSCKLNMSFPFLQNGSSHVSSEGQIWWFCIHIGCTSKVSLLYVSIYAFSGRKPEWLHICIVCTYAAFPQSASEGAFSGQKHYELKSCIVCTYAAFPHHCDRRNALKL